MLSVNSINSFAASKTFKQYCCQSFTSANKIILNTGEEILEDSYKIIMNRLLILKRNNMNAFYSLAKNTIFSETEKITDVRYIDSIFKSGLYNVEPKLSQDAIKVIKAITKVEDDAIKFVDAITGN